MDILTVGFATTVAMWAIGYAGRMPPAIIPAPVLLVLMLLCLLVGGMTITRHTGRAAWGGAMVGVLSAGLNLLILGGVLAGEGTNELVPAAAIWIPGSIVVSGVVSWLGALIMRGRPGPQYTAETWRSAFVVVTGVATLLVIVAGGLVTSTETGLAVPDWPNSFGSNMFLYPLAKMTGGVYFEHAHRLYGSLVGLTTVVLAVILLISDRRGWLRGLAVAAVVMVVIQGVLGGLRVDSALTFSTDPAETEPSLALAVVHGIFAQVFFVVVFLLWAFTTRLWATGAALPPGGDGTDDAGPASSDRTMTAVLVGVTLAQLVFGALYRHIFTEEQPLPWPAHIHLTLAAVVAILAYFVGLRCWARYTGTPLVRRLGFGLMILISLQLLLGLAALVAVLARRDGPNAAEVILATAHQANGALMLVVTTQLAVWVRRLPPPPPPPETPETTESSASA